MSTDALNCKPPRREGKWDSLSEGSVSPTVGLPHGVSGGIRCYLNSCRILLMCIRKK